MLFKIAGSSCAILDLVRFGFHEYLLVIASPLIVKGDNSLRYRFVCFRYGSKKPIPPRNTNAKAFIGILTMMIDMEAVVAWHKSPCPFAMKKVMNIAKCS